MNGFTNTIDNIWQKITAIFKKEKLFKQNKNHKKMSKGKIVEILEEDNGGKVNEIPHSKALYVGQFTNEVDEPEFFQNATNIKAVFEHFKPEVEAEFVDEEGASVNEILKFSEIRDFEVDNGKGKLVNNSPFLSELKNNVEANAKMSKLITQNSRLKALLANAESKEELCKVLQYLLDELENVK